MPPEPAAPTSLMALLEKSGTVTGMLTAAGLSRDTTAPRQVRIRSGAGHASWCSA